MNFKQKLQSPKGLSNFQKLRNVVKKKFWLLKPGFNRNCIYIKSDDFVFDKNAYKPEILGKYLSKKLGKKATYFGIIILVLLAIKYLIN